MHFSTTHRSTESSTLWPPPLSSCLNYSPRAEEAGLWYPCVRKTYRVWVCRSGPQPLLRQTDVIETHLHRSGATARVNYPTALILRNSLSLAPGANSNIKVPSCLQDTLTCCHLRIKQSNCQVIKAKAVLTVRNSTPFLCPGSEKGNITVYFSICFEINVSVNWN